VAPARDRLQRRLRSRRALARRRRARPDRGERPRRNRRTRPGVSASAARRHSPAEDDAASFPGQTAGQAPRRARGAARRGSGLGCLRGTVRARKGAAAQGARSLSACRTDHGIQGLARSRRSTGQGVRGGRARSPAPQGAKTGEEDRLARRGATPSRAHRRTTAALRVRVFRRLFSPQRRVSAPPQAAPGASRGVERYRRRSPPRRHRPARRRA